MCDAMAGTGLESWDAKAAAVPEADGRRQQGPVARSQVHAQVSCLVHVYYACNGDGCIMLPSWKQVSQAVTLNLGHIIPFTQTLRHAAATHRV